MTEVLDEFDSTESFAVPGHAIQPGEITRKQIDLYRRMGAEPPTSLHIDPGIQETPSISCIPENLKCNNPLNF